MNSDIKVEISDTGLETLKMLGQFVALYLDDFASKEEMRNLLMYAMDRIAVNPEQFPVCPELDLLGVTYYRQLTFKGYKVLFRLLSDNTRSRSAVITAFLSRRQSAEKVLIQYVLRRS